MNYLAIFGFSIVPQNAEVVGIVPPEISIKMDEKQEEFKLPLYTQLTSREKMHKFVDDFFDKIEAGQ